MSRIFKILMMTFSMAVLMFACEEKEESPTDAELTIREADKRPSFTNAAGSVSIAVTASGTYTATVKSGAEWCTVSDPGNQGFKINVSENTARAQRTAEITVSSPGCTDIEIVVTQLGLEPALIIDSWYRTVTFQRGGGDTVVAVTANGQYTATVETGADWVTVSDVGGQGFKISVAQNAKTIERSAKITIAMTGATNVEITVIQGASASLTITDADKNLFFEVTGGTKTVIPFLTNGEYEVTVEGDPEWCTILDTVRSNFSIIVSRNLEIEERLAKIIITVASQPEVPPVEINVKQEAAVVKVSTPQITLNSVFAHEETVTVSSRAPGFNGSAFTLDPVESWITVTRNGTELKLNIDAPPFDGSGRTSRVVVRIGVDSAEVNVSQAACLDKSLMTPYYVGDDNRTVFAPGQEMTRLFDGVSDKYPTNSTVIFCTAQNIDGTNDASTGAPAWTFPFCITMDLGADVYLNSFKITPRNNRASRKWEYRLGSPYNFEIWGTNVDKADIPADDPYWKDAWKSDWQYLGNFTTYNLGGYTPAEISANGIGILTDADCLMAAEGYPFALQHTTSPVRYLRFQINEVWEPGITYVHFNELWFWGEKEKK
jgi:hypothetical protein